MHKNKDGKVVASLTEVKNRTGDIFALVDEFGEVYLTSYNKVRYVISKTDISNFIELKEGNGKAEKKAEKVVKQSKASKPSHEEKKEEEDSMFKKITNMIPWDRDSKSESKFSDNSRNPLVNN